MYKNAFDFWILTWYPLFYQIHLLGIVVFLVESIGFSVHTIMSSANNDSFAPSFPIWMPFISFSCLIAVARTSNTMLNRSGKSRHPCLVHYLSGNTFSMMLAVGLSYMVFIMLRDAPSTPILLSVFNHKWVLYCIKCFFPHLLIWSCDFCYWRGYNWNSIHCRNPKVLRNWRIFNNFLYFFNLSLF